MPVLEPEPKPQSQPQLEHEPEPELAPGSESEPEPELAAGPPAHTQLACHDHLSPASVIPAAS